MTSIFDKISYTPISQWDQADKNRRAGKVAMKNLKGKIKVGDKELENPMDYANIVDKRDSNITKFLNKITQ